MRVLVKVVRVLVKVVRLLVKVVKVLVRVMTVLVKVMRVLLVKVVRLLNRGHESACTGCNYRNTQYEQIIFRQL
jgi:hypothetical protein